MQPEEIRRTVSDLQRTIHNQLGECRILACMLHPHERHALTLAIPDLDVSCGSIHELLAVALPAHSQVLLICDDHLADGGADELIRQMKARLGSRCHVVLILDEGVSDERLLRLTQHRPQGLLIREHCGEGQILQAVACTLRGGLYRDPSLAERLEHGLKPRSAHPWESALSTPDEQLLRMLASGRTTSEIASLLQLRADTIRRRLSGLYRRTGARDRSGLVLWGLQQGLLRPPDLQPAHPPQPAAARE